MLLCTLRPCSSYWLMIVSAMTIRPVLLPGEASVPKLSEFSLSESPALTT